MPSPRPSESFLRSDHRQNAPIAATMVAIITGTNSRRSSLGGIRLALHRFQGSSLPELVSRSLTAVISTLIPPADASTSATGGSPRQLRSQARRDLHEGIGGAFLTPDTCKMASLLGRPRQPRRGFQDCACLSRCPAERQCLRTLWQTKDLPDRDWRETGAHSAAPNADRSALLIQVRPTSASRIQHVNLPTLA